MKYISLFILLTFLFSCSHSVNRLPANGSDEHYIQKYREESIRYLLSYEPKKYGSFEENLSEEREEELFQILGKIDLGQMKPIHSRFLGKEKGFNHLINTSGVRQISFSEWKNLESEVVGAYRRGDYVFRKGSFFYTLSGLRLKIENIDERIFFAARNYITDLDKFDLSLSIFNRRTIYSFGSLGGLILPTGTYINERVLSYIQDDFEKQVGREIDIDPKDLINYNFRVNLNTQSDYRIYRNEKYQGTLEDQPIEDFEEACRTKFYYRSLSRIPEALKFVKTLLIHKPRLMNELSLSNNEYDELIVLALGILAVESKMGRSLKYKIKEDIRIGKLNLGQMAIRLVKKLKGRDDENSRGLTQIKNIGPLLKDSRYAYLEHSNLDDPSNAALATMFVLKEKLGYLRHFASKHSNITKDNWADYLYYFYQGSSSQITKGKATPPLNLRIQKILEVKNRSMVFRNCN